MHELIGDIITVVEAGPAVPASPVGQGHPAHETFLALRWRHRRRAG